MNALAGCAEWLAEEPLVGGWEAEKEEGCGACVTRLRLVEACCSAHHFHYSSEETLGLEFHLPPLSSCSRLSHGNGAGAGRGQAELRFPKHGGFARRQKSY